MRFMQIESVLQTKNRSGPAKNRFSVAQVRVIRAYVLPSVDQVKIFIQGRISRPINGSKLIFHMRMYIYETSRNIQEP